ncbi:MAG TPA: helix-turn-helix domain-containing protein [Thioalkalivibrio sp.]|nr:helix-turn-helix domain-containing protein [Thioalkalivibrio sp.]
MEESTDTRPNTDANMPGPGATLRRTRKEQGLTQEQVATDLHLPRRVVDALERDDFAALPETTTYLKGYLRSYAKLLGLDAAPLLQSVERLVGPALEWVPTQPATAIEPGFRGVHWISGGVVAMVVVLLAVWWTGDSVEEDADMSTVAEAPRSESPAVSPDDEVAVAELPAQSATAEVLATPDAVTPEPVTVTNLTPEPAAAPPAPQRNDGQNATGEDRLQLSFSEASWVEVYDANRQQLLYGLFKGGEQRTVQGTAPFRVMLGYAPGVEVRINGEYYDHLTRVRGNNTVRFNIARPSDDL